MAQAQPVAERDILFEALVRKHLKETSSPETILGLVNSAPLKGQPFIFIFRFDLDRKKRPDMLEAPCPICSPHAPKYFHGALAWFPVEGVYRCIGIECAGHFIGKAEAEKAKRYMEETESRNADYEFLVENLGLAPKMIRYFEALFPAATHAEQLRRDLSTAHVREPLRKALKNGNGQLHVWENIDVEKVDSTTSATRTVVEAQRVEFGGLSGLTALASASSFHVVQGLRLAVGKLGIVAHGEDEVGSTWALENAYDHPDDMASFCSILRHAKPSRLQFERKIGDVLAFFTEDNFARLARFGADPRNPISIFASIRNNVFRIGETMSRTVSITPNFDILKGLPEWPELRMPSAIDGESSGMGS